MGLLHGEAGAHYDLRTINGVSIGKWTVGLGLGIDNYAGRSVPVFIEGRKEFGKKNNLPFLYAGAGLNHTWLTTDQKRQKGGEYSTTPGMYVDAGIGVKLNTKSKTAVVLSTGFSYKQSKETVVPPVWFTPWPMPGNPDGSPEKLNSQYRRIVVRLGIQI